MKLKDWLLMKIINKIKCYFSGHNFIVAGSCPYTGSTYDYCDKCHIMVPRDPAE